MTENKFYTPLKIGLFVVVLSYFLFTLHAVFTLSWWGEWNRIGGTGHFLFPIYAEDISAFVGDAFRFAASIIALAAIVFYFAKKNVSKPAAYKIVKGILILEAIYWLGLATTAYYEVQGLFFSRSFSHFTSTFILKSFGTSVLPSVLESIAIPIVLLIFAYKVSLNKPLKGAIRWGLISGTLIIFVFWLTNTGSWIGAIDEKGIGYLNSHPQHILSFVLTAVGLLVLGIYSAVFTFKSRNATTLQELNLKGIGVIILALGMYFLWNYLSWIFFGGDYVWSSWYAWFLGHNLDLWMLSLPLLGLPLLFNEDRPDNSSEQATVNQA